MWQGSVRPSNVGGYSGFYTTQDHQEANIRAFVDAFISSVSFSFSNTCTRYCGPRWYLFIISQLLIPQHNNYDHEVLLNDIALLILREALVFTSSVQPVGRMSPYKLDKIALTGDNCTVSGWGYMITDRK